jgi:hypothetical protein
MPFRALAPQASASAYFATSTWSPRRGLYTIAQHPIPPCHFTKRTERFGTFLAKPQLRGSGLQTIATLTYARSCILAKTRILTRQSAELESHTNRDRFQSADVSATRFKLDRPSAKSLPISLSMLINTLITLLTNWFLPLIVHVT